MCGISGIVSLEQPIYYDQKIIKKMTKTLTRRGPDENNYWVNENVHFGHQRLAIIDIENGKQPMIKKQNNKNIVLIYNGELYNTDKLRKTLQLQNFKFNGHSDTEVVLNAYIKWGADFITHLNGIFAFAIWDERNNTLILGRDRLGVKPLFYTIFNNTLIFASEIKAILAHPNIQKKISHEKLAELISLGPSRYPGSGVFNNIFELLPGHFLIFEKSSLVTKKYWDVISQPHYDNYEETVEKTRTLLTQAIKRQLVSDIGICTFLSGGIDSSAITAIAATQNTKALRTYSIEYEENAHHFSSSLFQPNRDEYYIKLMSNFCNTDHKEIILQQHDLVYALKEATIARDTPGMADIDSSLLLFCREVKKDYSVALSGECADEIFGGYPWFKKDFYNLNSGFPWISSQNERNALLNDFWQEKLDIVGTLESAYKKTINETPLLYDEDETCQKMRQIFYLCMKWFMATLLERKDRMSMYESVEVRVPFADHKLVEYAWNIPWNMKIKNGREKAVLRDATSHLLPKEIKNRKKSPYPKTHHPKYTQLVRNELQTILKTETILKEIFDKNKLSQLILGEFTNFKTPWFGQLMTGPQLIAYLLQIHYWFEHNRPTIVL